MKLETGQSALPGLNTEKSGPVLGCSNTPAPA